MTFLSQKHLALYLHYPWCEQKCPYCDFNVHLHKNARENTYFDCIIKDLSKRHININGCLLISVFIGGGTPSLAKAENIASFLDYVRASFAISDSCEITMEINPSAFVDFSSYAMAGVNRFSIGVQSFDNSFLKFLGRLHTAEQAEKQIAKALEQTPNVNIDLMYGIPGQSIQNWAEQLKYAIDLNLPHISAYQLTIEKNSVFYSQVNKHRLTPTTDEKLLNFFKLTKELLTDAGYENYEISNFAKENFTCRHNMHVWQYGNYIGIGAGAHGRIKQDNIQFISAIRNYRMPDVYMTHVQQGGTGIYEKTELTSEEALKEQFLMGLRLKQGVCTNKSQKTFETSLHKALFSSNRLKKLCAEGLLERTDNHIKLTKKGWFVLDSVLDYLFS